MRRERSQPAATIEPASAPAVAGRWLDGAIHRRLIVHTKTDKSYRGILRLNAEDGVLLWAAELLENEPVKIAGDLFIPHDEIHVIQTDTEWPLSRPATPG